MPSKPPTLDEIHDKMAESSDNRWWSVRRLGELYETIDSPLRGKYLHWDKLRHYPPPSGLSHEEWWYLLKIARRQRSNPVPLQDRHGQPFSYVMLDAVHEQLQEIDQTIRGLGHRSGQLANRETRDQYSVDSLIQEAVTSSQIEGAATTRVVAKDMIRTGRAPRDKSEQMILNNFRTMQHVGTLKDRALSKDLVLEIHRIITEKTLEQGAAAGRFRQTDEQIVVGDMYGEVFHNPPPAKQLEERMAAMCEFANGRTPDKLIHPVLRSIILHFWLAYDHPFVDGNGRVARALFYWSMLRHKDHWLFEFISISQIILNAPAKYGRAFLYTETDDNDLTYFIIHQFDVIQRAVKELHRYIQKKTAALHALEGKLRGVTELNHRQQTLIGHALRHPQQRYTFKSHQMSHNIVYQTARTDLLDLEKRSLLNSRKVGRTWVFTPALGLEKRLASLDAP